VILLNENFIQIKTFLKKSLRKKGNYFSGISTNIPGFQQEVGGDVWLKNEEFVLNKSENSSNKWNEFVTEFDMLDLFNEDFRGFWHTHPKFCLPSPPDIFQLIKLNLRFKRNYLMIIIGKKRFSVVEFNYRFIPKIRIETLN